MSRIEPERVDVDGPLRFLFVSGTGVGGSGRSQRELAVRLVSFGHQVTFVVDPEGKSWRRRLYEQLADASVRLGTSKVSEPLRWLERQPGRRSQYTTVDGIAHMYSPVPENALISHIDAIRPHVVVGNSILRLAWKKIRAECERRGIATVLYIREEESLNHFVSTKPASAIVANAESLVRRIREAGFECAFVPSVVETGVTAVSYTHLTLPTNREV